MASFTIPKVLCEDVPPNRRAKLRTKYPTRPSQEEIERFVSEAWHTLAAVPGKKWVDGRLVHDPHQSKGPKGLPASSQWNSTPLTSFSLFPNLPVEIQDMIWRAAIDPETITLICLLQWHVQSSGLARSTQWFLETAPRQRYHTLLPNYQTCHRSRQCALEDYGSLVSGATLFNLRRDTLRLSFVCPVRGIWSRGDAHLGVEEAEQSGRRHDRRGLALLAQAGASGKPRQVRFSERSNLYEEHDPATEYLRSQCDTWVTPVAEGFVAKARHLEVLFFCDPLRNPRLDNPDQPWEGPSFFANAGWFKDFLFMMEPFKMLRTLSLRCGVQFCERTLEAPDPGHRAWWLRFLQCLIPQMESGRFLELEVLEVVQAYLFPRYAVVNRQSHVACTYRFCEEPERKKLLDGWGR
jgi:hypothetical protein